MALLIITTILWAFSFSFYGEYLAGHVDSYFAVLVRVGLAALVFLPFLRTRSNSLKTVGLYMLVGAMQLGVMYMLSFRAYLYLTVSELLLFTVLTPLYITLIYDIMSKRRLRWGYAFSALLAQAEAFRGLGVEIKREINPDLAEQAVSQDEEYRLRSVPEQPNDEAYQRDDEYNQQSR
ncbi:EamA family transporter [Escherichia coli]|nr:EamA family transporter [Escherichia coli]